MCIVFICSECKDESDYQFILIENRDEVYDRPTKDAGPWDEDSTVFGGRDMKEGCNGGTWFAISPVRKKLALLLNLRGKQMKDAITRGKLVQDFVTSDDSAEAYVEELRKTVEYYNGFTLLTVEFGAKSSKVNTFNNFTNEFEEWREPYLGFSNSVPNKPLRKVIAGKERFEDICKKYNKVENKDKLVDELVELLRWKILHPEPGSEEGNPLDAVCVCVPAIRYGTRTHSVVLLTKTGQLEFIEFTMQPPVNIDNPIWKRTEYKFNLSLNINWSNI